MKVLQWSGQCIHCGAWNSLNEALVDDKSLTPAARVTRLNNVAKKNLTRVPTNINELDRVLGGGVVPGSVILLGGDPGIGKSTLALQWLGSQISQVRALYVSGEESIQQMT